MVSKKLNLRLLNVSLLILVLVIVIVGVLLNNVRIETRALISRNVDTSIVRLHDADTGAFFCSGVVISNTRILTAAHCVFRQGLFGESVAVDKVEIRTQTNKPMGIIANFEAANARQDLAILSGDFRGMDQRGVVSDTAQLNSIFMNSNIDVVACGFPDGGRLACSHITDRDRILFFFSAKGYLYPGMSGGPVIDMTTGKVIAVNQAVTDSRVVVSPLIELYDNLGLNEKPKQ